MSIHGAGKQEALSTRQINNFLKLCIKCVDFSHSGLLREDGPALIIERIYKKLMPDLNVEDICIDALEKKFIKFIKKEALLSTSPLLTRAFLQVCKQITTNNPHFRENRYGEILSECILEGLRDYFWPALDYQEVPFDDDVPTVPLLWWQRWAIRDLYEHDLRFKGSQIFLAYIKVKGLS